MSGESSDQDTKQTADVSTKEDASKDANGRSSDLQDTGKAGSADKKSDEDVSGLKKALKAERERADKLEKAQRDAELAKLPELERAQAEVKQLTDENEKLKTENMRQKIALSEGLPWSLAKRLSGETEDEMRADAADLLKDYKPAEKQIIKDDPKNKKPTNDAKKSGTAGGPGMNDILRALAGRKAT